jgi:hypothetical protein
MDMRSHSMVRAGWLAAAALCVLLSGCGGRTFWTPTPAGFVELEDQRPAYDYRATSADGLVIGIREIKHEPQGDTAFWVQAIRNQMRSMAGYALVETVSVTTKDGVKGTQLRFGHDEKGEPLLYYLTVFVTEKKIYLLEFGGSKQEMTRFAAQLTWVVDNFRVT